MTKYKSLNNSVEKEKCCREKLARTPEIERMNDLIILNPLKCEPGKYSLVKMSMFLLFSNGRFKYHLVDYIGTNNLLCLSTTYIHLQCPVISHFAMSSLNY